MDIFIKNGVIKKREEVEQTIYKKDYNTEYNYKIPGPYYDHMNNHCHVWKPLALIENFKGEQNQSEPKYRTHRGILPTRGVYCSICHMHLMGKGYDLKNSIEYPIQPYFKKRKTETELSRMLQNVKIAKRSHIILWDRLYILLLKKHISTYRRLYDALIDINKQKNKIVCKWQSLTKKLTEPYVYYPLNCLQSKLTKISDMTPFQIFKYNNPNYKNTTDCIIHHNKFHTNYVTIS